MFNLKPYAKKMSDNMQLSDSEFIIQFKSYTLSPSLFNHEAHLRMAWLYISIYGLEKGIFNIRKDLKSYVRHLEATDKYNETLTIAASHAVHHFMQKSTTTSFKQFISQYPQLLTQFRQLMETHYSTNIFTDEVAKREYLEPDLTPFGN
jgi:hypothetical protein